MEDWYKILRFKVNQIKSVQATFTLKLALYLEVTLYGTQIPPSPAIKYLSLTLDRHLTWAHRIKTKILQFIFRLLMLKTRIVNYKNSKLNMRLLLYKSLLKSIWTYDL